jgi:hypothetical protein
MEHAMTLESDTARKSVGGDAGKRNAMSRFRAALNAFDLPIQKPKTMMWGGEIWIITTTRPGWAVIGHVACCRPSHRNR